MARVAVIFEALEVRRGKRRRFAVAKLHNTMSDDWTTEPGWPAARAGTISDVAHREDLAAIVRRAGDMGIAAWRVEIALGLAAPVEDQAADDSSAGDSSES